MVVLPIRAEDIHDDMRHDCFFPLLMSPCILISWIRRFYAFGISGLYGYTFCSWGDMGIVMENSPCHISYALGMKAGRDG